MTVPSIPTSEPEDGAATLDALRALLVRYVALASPEAADAIALWIAATHAQTAWEHASRLVIKSPLKRCGKTRLLEVIEGTAHATLRTSNISPAALIRCVDPIDPPTFLLDEADTVFTKRRGEVSETAEALRGLLNAGHSRGGAYTRWDAQRRQIEHHSAYAMAAIACIGNLPDTIEDRAVVIPMRRRAPGEVVEPFRRRRAEPELRVAQERVAAWIADSTEALSMAEPTMPVEDRQADVWEPLIAVADAAGGGWPERARIACKALTASTDAPDDGTAGEQLLEDIRGVFEGQTALPTAQLLAALHGLAEAPWGDWFGHPLAPRDLARLLRPYGIRSKNVRTAASVVKGYERSQFEDAWARYARRDATSATGLPEPDDGLNPLVNQEDAHVAERDETSATATATRRSPMATPETGIPTTGEAAVALVAEVRQTVEMRDL